MGVLCEGHIYVNEIEICVPHSPIPLQILMSFTLIRAKHLPNQVKQGVGNNHHHRPLPGMMKNIHLWEEPAVPQLPDVHHN